MKDKLSFKDWSYVTLCCLGGASVGGYFGKMTGDFYAEGDLGIDILKYIGLVVGIIAGIVAARLFALYIFECRGVQKNFIVCSATGKGIKYGLFSALTVHIVSIIFSFFIFYRVNSFLLLALIIGSVIGIVSGLFAGFLLALLALAFGYHRPMLQKTLSLDEVLSN